MDVFGLQPERARITRASWTLHAEAPSARLLLMTDGFSALVGSVHAFMSQRAALCGCARISGVCRNLGRELRAIETADAGGARIRGSRQSDDATAMLLRLT